MTTGTFGFSTAPFRLDIGDFFAVGRLAVTAPPTCTVTFTTTDFTPFAGLIDVPLAATCTIETDNSLTIVANGVPATSQPAIAVTQNLTGVIYVQSNIPTFNGNSVLVFRRDAEGNLAPPASFLSGGAGITADPVTTAPNDAFDSDLNIILNPSNTMLFTVNGGSDTIVVFYILPDDGALVPVAGSPFPSGGVNPVSVGLAGDKLYVVNKNRDLFRQDPTRSLPNYTGFRLGVDGALTPIANSTVASLQNASPTQALISTDNTLLFGSDFGVLRLQSFRIADNGVLEQNPPLALANLVLGLQVHPTERLLYAGLSLENLLAVFPYDANGILDATNVTIVANGGVEPCWLEVNQAGTRLYTANFRDNTVSTYDLSDPANPVEIQLLELDARGRGCPFQIGLESSEAFLYLVSQRGCFPDEIPLGEGNLLRVFRVNADGTLAEVDSSPNNLNNLGVPVDPFSRPQGIAAP
jgi:6-phosphogluconolactonase (cycloisomerase 2 family)